MSPPAFQKPPRSDPSPPEPGTTCPVNHMPIPLSHKKRHPITPIATDPITNKGHPTSPPGHLAPDFQHTPGGPRPCTICRYPALPPHVNTPPPSAFPPGPSRHPPSPHPTPSPATPPSTLSYHCEPP